MCAASMPSASMYERTTTLKFSARGCDDEYLHAAKRRKRAAEVDAVLRYVAGRLLALWGDIYTT